MSLLYPLSVGVSLWDRASREKGNSSCRFQYSEVGAQTQAGALIHSCGIYRHPGELMSNQPLSCRELLLLTIKTWYCYSAALMVIAAL